MRTFTGPTPPLTCCSADFYLEIVTEPHDMGDEEGEGTSEWSSSEVDEEDTDTDGEAGA